jgi:hypothetical protein
MSLVEMSASLGIGTAELLREKNTQTSPMVKSQFKQMQKTGKEAEYYFRQSVIPSATQTIPHLG